MASLSIINNFSLSSLGVIKSGKQGAADDANTDPFLVTVNGTCHYAVGTLATATVVEAYTAASDFPATFVYLFYWSDQISYIQVTGSATNAVLKVAAEQPFVLAGYGSILAAASTTNIAGGSEPAVTAVSKIVLGNYSGTTMNYLLALIS